MYSAGIERKQLNTSTNNLYLKYFFCFHILFEQKTSKIFNLESNTIQNAILRFIK